jgi:hypothetical protein
MGCRLVTPTTEWLCHCAGAALLIRLQCGCVLVTSANDAAAVQSVQQTMQATG